MNERMTMAYPTAVNNQITDSVTQANTKVLGDAPAIAMGNLYMATSQAIANAAHNATNSQQQSYVTMQATTVQAVSTLLSLDTATTGVPGKVLDPLANVEDVAGQPKVATDPTGLLAEAASSASASFSPIPEEFAHDAIHLQAALAWGLAMENAVAYLQASYTIAIAAKACAYSKLLSQGEASPAGQELVRQAEESVQSALHHLEQVQRIAGSTAAPPMAASAAAGA
jgi:hypothetical protein